MVAGEVPDALEVLDHLAIADGLGGGFAQRAVRGQQAANLVDQPGGEHRVHAAVDPAVKLLGGANRARRRGTRRPADPRRTAAASSLIGRPVFSNTSSARISRRVSFGCSRPAATGSTCGEPPVEPVRRFVLGLPSELLAKRRVGRRALEDPPQEPLQIERRSADEEHLATPAANFLDAPPGRLDVLGQAVLLVGRRLRRSGGAASRGARRRWVSPCRCPCLGTGPSSPSRRSRPRSAAPARRPRASCPTPSARSETSIVRPIRVHRRSSAVPSVLTPRHHTATTSPSPSKSNSCGSAASRSGRATATRSARWPGGDSPARVPAPTPPRRGACPFPGSPIGRPTDAAARQDASRPERSGPATTPGNRSPRRRSLRRRASFPADRRRARSRRASEGSRPPPCRSDSAASRAIDASSR